MRRNRVIYNVGRVIIWRFENGGLDAIRVGKVVIEFSKHDTWLPLYARRLIKIGKFQVWRDS